MPFFQSRRNFSFAVPAREEKVESIPEGDFLVPRS